MDPDDIMVLDGGDEVYIWIGVGSTEEEIEKSTEMAKVKFFSFFNQRILIYIISIPELLALGPN